MKANRKFSKDEEAVSPVIGVILMVAITVILAAVIAAFVFGMGGSLKKQYVVAATVSQTGTSTVDFTYQGGPDASSLYGIQIVVNNTFFNSAGGEGSEGDYVFGNESATAAVAVGSTQTLTSTTYQISPGRDHVVVMGYFADGSKQVIVDTYV